MSEFLSPVDIDHYDTLLLRVEDAARQLAISRGQLFRLIASEEIETVKIGASRRVPARSLVAYVDRLLADQGTQR